MYKIYMVILIFDTGGGLCNQMNDIVTSLSFCLKYNLKFSFRNCTFRDKNNLIKFYTVPFENLFSDKFLLKFNNFVNYNLISNSINNNNTFNINSLIINTIFNNEDQLFFYIEKNKDNFKYFIVPRLYTIFDFKNIIYNFYYQIYPNQKIESIFINLKNKILPDNYNFIHFRYEKDFIDFFNEKENNINDILNYCNFKNKNLKTYIACSNLSELNCNSKDIINKDNYLIESNLFDLNFEEKAYLDFLIGINSNEIFGHKKSSFSCLLNFIKNTKNFY